MDLEDVSLATFETTRQEWAAEVVTLAVERFERRLVGESEVLCGAVQRLDVLLRSEMRQQRDALREEMRAERAELLKWSLVFWLAQVAATAAVVAGLR